MDYKNKLFITTNNKYKSDITTAFSRQIFDSDAKKANELVPSMMVVNFLSASSDDDGKKKRVNIFVKMKTTLIMMLS